MELELQVNHNRKVVRAQLFLDLPADAGRDVARCCEDTRGAQLASALEDSQFIVLNSYGNTRAPPGGPKSSPDVSAATGNVSPCISWHIKKQLSSDHLPTAIDLQHKLQRVKTQKKSTMNLRKADWSKYADALESSVADMTTLDHNADVREAEKEFRSAINSAACSSIPCGRRPAAIPGLTREITQLMEKRDTLRASLHDNSSAEEREHLSSLNKDIENKDSPGETRQMERIRLFPRQKNSEHQDLEDHQTARRSSCSSATKCSHTIQRPGLPQAESSSH